MSLGRGAAGAGRALGPIAGQRGISAPASTWPQRVAEIPPNTRGGALLGLSAFHRPLSQRDRDQLNGARRLPPQIDATIGVARPLAHATATRSFRPMPVDRSFRQPYFVPHTPGSSSGAGDSGSGSGGDSGSGRGGCC